MILILVSITATADVQGSISVNYVLCIFTYPASVKNICCCAGSVSTIVEYTGLAAENVLTLISETVSVEIVSIVSNNLLTCEVLTSNEIHNCITNYIFTLVDVARQVCTILIERIHLTIPPVRTSDLYTIDVVCSVVGIPTVSNYNTVNICLAVCINAIEEFAAYAGENAIDKFVCMSLCNSDCTPINNGVANCAVCSTCITIRHTCCFTISHCCYCVLMPAFASSLLSVNPLLSACYRLSGVVCEEELSVNKESLHTEGILGLVNEGYNTLLKSELNALCPNSTVVYQPCGSCELVTLVGCMLCCPCTNRERDERCLTCCCHITSLLDDDCSDVVILLD